MADYLLIESRDPFAWRDVDTYYELATELRNQGNDVVLFLVENGVLPARRAGLPPRPPGSSSWPTISPCESEASHRTTWSTRWGRRPSTS
jgi:hypothetical protein